MNTHTHTRTPTLTHTLTLTRRQPISCTFIFLQRRKFDKGNDEKDRN